MEAIFEYLMVLTSIIIGLGVATILRGLGEMLRSRETVRESATHLGAVAVIFVLALQHWWDTWSLHEVTYWTFPGLLMHLAGPVILFLASYVTFPRDVSNQDLLEYYHSQTLLLWSLGALYLASALAYRPLVYGDDVISVRAGVRAIAFVLCVVLAFSRSRRLHAVGVWVAAALLMLFIALFGLSAEG